MTYVLARKDGTPLTDVVYDTPVYRNPLKFSDEVFTVYLTRKEALDVLHKIQNFMRAGTFSDRSYKVLATLHIREREGN
jgi:hypothetical protein